MRRAFWVLVIGVTLPMFASCIFSPKEKPPVDDRVVDTFKSLTVRDNLLHNLELSYRQRNYEEFRKLLDSSGAFIFFFSPTDVQAGDVTSSQWGVAQELSSTQALFHPNPPPGDPYASSITLDLTFSEDDEDWQPIVPGTHPTETWYQKTVSYFLEVKVGDVTYTQNRAVDAVFTVRFADVAGDTLWQIVTWQDDV